MSNSTEIKQREYLKTLFADLFRKNGLGIIDSFSSNAFFLQKTIKGLTAKEYFESLLTQTPKEDDDIIQFILFRSFNQNKAKSGLYINVGDFIEEIVSQIINISNENMRLETLIKKYDAYETVNTIEQNITHFEKYEERVYDKTKSTFTAYLSKIKNITKGDFSFSILISTINSSNASDTREYKLNHVIKINDDLIDDSQSFGINEYQFPQIDFYAEEDSQSADSGTNFQSFQIKMDNLNKNYNDYLLSEKFKFLELLIGNSKALLNNFQKVKTVEGNLTLQNAFFNTMITIVFNIEFDACTLMSVYQKLKQLLKNIISYKVRVEHKYKTILSYFESIAKEIEALINPPPKKEPDCIIF